MGTSIPVRSNGQIIDQAWFNTPRSEISTLDDRVDRLASGNSKVFNIGGYYNIGSKDSVAIIPITQSITLTSVVLKCLTVGSSGNTQVDVKVKRGASSWTSILTTKPLVPASAGDYADSSTGAGATAAVINASLQSLVPNDLVRVDQEISQAGNPDTYFLTLYHTIDGV